MKKFLFGCGAQKTGTTWLAKNFKNSPEYWNGGIKEWRFWKYYFDNNSRLLQLREMKKGLHEIHDSYPLMNMKKLKWRISVLQHPESFLRDVVDNFIAKVNVKVLGDMTPSNGILEIEEFSFIKEYFNKRGIIVKPLLILRDPFERIWSAARMKIKNHYSVEYQKNGQFVNEMLLETYRLKTVEKRTRYEHIIENLERVFDEQDICYEFSENLFSQDSLDRVSSHLGISNITVDNCSPNPSPKLTVVPTQIRQEIINFYRDTYLSVFDKFGDDAKEFWTDSFKLL